MNSFCLLGINELNMLHIWALQNIQTYVIKPTNAHVHNMF